MPISCPISLEHSFDEQYAKELAARYHLTVETCPPFPFLSITPEGLNLFVMSAQGELVFSSTLMDSLVRQEEGKTLLLKALGKRQPGEKILDATAGLLRDALTIRLSGLSVIALERSNILYAISNEAMLQARENPALRVALTQGFRFLQVDAKDFFKETDNLKDVAVIYLDPMFEESKQSAQVKAPMQALRAILPDEESPEILLEAALQTGVKRVVVKRHKNAPLLKAKPSQQLIGKTIRFDVYI